MKVCVVCPVLNNLFYTKLFLKSLERQTFKDFAVIIVDNGSTDGTSQWLLKEWVGTNKPYFCWVVVNNTNRGYAGGCNDGLAKAHELYPDADVLITNNDMELFPSCVEQLVSASVMLGNKAGVLGGRLLFPDGRIQHGGAFVNVYGWGQHKLAGAHDSEFLETQPVEQEYVTGALFYITRECLTALPMFDEQFNPAYFEEVDYCTEARKKGFSTVYVPTAKATHYESKTSTDVLGDAQQVSDLSRFNQLKYYFKHDNDVATYEPTSDRRALITGKIYGDWSFSIVLRNIAKGLKNNGVDVSIAPEEYHNPMNMDDWIISEMIKKPNDFWNRVVMRSSEGDHQYLMPAGIKRIAHTTFEGTRPPQTWVEQLNHVDAVVTNSTFCRNIMIDRGIKTPIHVIPNSVDTLLFSPDAIPIQFDQRRKFGFLAMSAYGERKNLEMLLKAFILEFKPDEDVFLSLHSLSLFYILHQSKTDVQTWIRNVVLGGKDMQHAPIFITSNSMHPTVVPQMITAHDCGIFPSKCEGFGNFLIEAAACGLPCITTNYSGMVDFIDEEVGYPLNGGKLVDMPLQVLPYYKNYVGSKWMEPDIDELRDRMRYAFTHQDDVKVRGRNALTKVAAYDITPVGKKFSEVMFGY